jgi:hypothetical protein
MSEIIPTNFRLSRIQRVSNIFKIVFFVVTILCIIGGMGLLISAWFFPDVKGIKFILAAGFEFTCAVLFSVCYKLFDAYSRGELFTGKIVHCIRRVSYAYFLMALAGFVSRAVSVYHLHATAGSPTARAGFEWEWSGLFTSLFPGFLILFIAWIMDEGRKIREEQELTV